MWRAALLLAIGTGAAHADDILSARYVDPTDRYDHGILGDRLEWGAIEIVTGASGGNGFASGSREFTWKIALPEDRVFEDTEPRLWDITGDGSPEVVTVLTQVDLGASLVVIGREDGKVRRIASTPHIGQTHRWLAPVGAADLDGDGRVEIAYVDRPHLDRVLRLWRYEKGDLREIARLAGVTNHRIGDSAISGGLRDCGAGPELIVASADWTRTIAVSFDGRSVAGRILGPLDFAAALACRQ